MTEVVDDLAARLWPGRVVSIEVLAHGITNSNYVVDLGDERVVVRVPGTDTHLLGIDRSNEVVAGGLAAAIGVGPEVLATDDGTGCIVFRFIDGRPISTTELSEEPMLRLFAETLRHVHSAGTTPTIWNPYDVIRDHRDVASARGVTPPFDAVSALTLLERIEAARPFRPVVLGHNDLLNANFLFDDRLRIVDWEYAGMSDPFFDLANAAVNNGFPVDAEIALLRYYVGDVSEPVVSTLHLMKIVSELREAMWGVVQMAISSLEVDFTTYARERGEHAIALSLEGDFDEHLELARRYARAAT
jgi:aminoglycoside phosphotransferase (APT) family kinase protein